MSQINKAKELYMGYGDRDIANWVVKIGEGGSGIMRRGNEICSEEAQFCLFIVKKSMTRHSNVDLVDNVLMDDNSIECISSHFFTTTIYYYPNPHDD